eukprot:5257749-Heterocapsa_arctica.AAC.1
MSLDTNYPQFIQEGVAIVDQEAEGLFTRISQPTSQNGAPRFPKFKEVIAWIQQISADIAATIKEIEAKTEGLDPTFNLPVISFAADNRAENHNSLIQATARFWRQAADEHDMNSVFIYFLLDGLWDGTVIWFVRVIVALALGCLYPKSAILYADTDCGPGCMDPFTYSKRSLT